MAVEQQGSNGEPEIFDFSICSVNVKQIFVMDKKNNKKKDAMSGDGGKVKGILSTELTQAATIKVEDGGMPNKDTKTQDNEQDR
mgnify:CR=1 FL=1